MKLYPAILFIHAIAVLALTATLTVESLLLAQLRRTGRPSDARIWIGAVPAIGIAAVSSLVVILITGGYLSKSLNATGFAWSRFAVLDTIIFALFGAFSGLRLRGIRRDAREKSAGEAEWRTLTQSAFLKFSLSTRIWVVMGTVLLTAAKPDLRESLLIVGSSLILGLLCSFISFGSGSAVSTVQTESR
ncbi:MAG TPA: hypothetical protein VGF96_04955 [Terracidiphilus sp.]|jgi:hypothetical protein